ncbi:1-(5-phosphoribosyl)-5-[(5-phosphoribosylamino)methylideneamino]imidazole-4-carboxamide isomerase [Alicyclobacillus fastidiosus]|uniref:1-(5-phosphoribosyl)-5-[(5-phosphoribosylamino)methylideneamino] imidazole-4-carboxamide isomerase n=1 Tax=Alicyclobacillus fastidiosus TaxID=392011 RepID=A0ABY6ZFM0_9BACL|nr:1-(5-phosphoribosyl)-5-[(5-phosphoribosylamino)methylideneamino]imidazole-4-carboxamide isomerase [Alicyclobacillus fastidiosus]WAH40910.1 1-(5-phosphoribosyl)-5-[(5-phosphoribosylamino)methylideneamino]imidazole-4-carboxamide isomerase [Alicyclobacillus fastidiosus]GMA62405.1 1-(5-phosphoribosyl)-5-[(5-phosphoribosylamino) methylideneamino] imidazole-4-carboxamide isomerase [Alicyclobacillus fastidiosus]
MSGYTFTLLPAIDILEGRCVRLLKGDYAAKTEYSENPVEVAKTWCEQGAKFLHVVDLDGAKDGHGVNRDVIGEIVKLAAGYGAQVEVGGGIRTTDAIAAWLRRGVSRVVLGTASRNVEQMSAWVDEFGSERLVAGLDGRDGKLAVDGWIEQTNTSIVELAAQLHDVGVQHALVTDVEKDGTLSGANLALADAVQQVGLGAIASGGIRDEEDVVAALKAGLSGAVVGKSLYDGQLDLAHTIIRLRQEGALC